MCAKELSDMAAENTTWRARRFDLGAACAAASVGAFGAPNRGRYRGVELTIISLAGDTWARRLEIVRQLSCPSCALSRAFPDTLLRARRICLIHL